MPNPFHFFWNTRNPHDSIRDQGKRKATQRQPQSEDWMVRDNDRARMSAIGKDLYRNYSVAGWAFRKNLDYCTVFDFQSKTGVESYDQQVEQFITWWSDRNRCDALRKHPLRSLIRIGQQLALTDGDVFFLKIGGRGSQRGSIQLIESDRIRTPRGVRGFADTGGLPSSGGAESLKTLGVNPNGWENGVRLNMKGIVKEYGLHNRTNYSEPEFARTIPAANMIHHGFFYRADMVRGVSPINEAANSFRDLYETTDYAIAGVKAAQLVGLYIKRDSPVNDLGAFNTQDRDKDGFYESGPAITWGPRPKTIYGRPGEDATFLDARKPAIETTTFIDALIHMSIKCFDIPKSFWDASEANYSSMRMDKIEFNRSIEPKRQDVQNVLEQITRWRLSMAIADGELPTPPGGMRLDEMLNMMKWIPRGTPWVDPEKEVAGMTQAIEQGLDNPYRAAAQNGTSYEDNIDLKIKAELYEQQKRIEAGLAPTSQPSEDEENEQ